MRRVTSGGGWPAIWYSFRMAWKVGPWRFWQAMSSKNACKTCALGMGGQLGGMRNEAGHWPEVCKKSMQAMAADMQGAIKPEFFARYSIDELRTFSPREMETAGRLVEPVIAEPGSKHYRPISWKEAITRIVGQLKTSTPDETFFYFSGRSSNEASFILQLFGRLFGTNNINNCSFYCHQASGVGLASASAPAPPPSRSKMSTMPTSSSSSAAIPLPITSPYAHADGSSPARRKRHRHQPRQRNRPGQLPHSVGCLQPLVRLSHRQPLLAAPYRRRHPAHDRHRQNPLRAKPSRRELHPKVHRQLGRLPLSL